MGDEEPPLSLGGIGLGDSLDKIHKVLGREDRITITGSSTESKYECKVLSFITTAYDMPNGFIVMRFAIKNGVVNYISLRYVDNANEKNKILSLMKTLLPELRRGVGAPKQRFCSKCGTLVEKNSVD